MKLTDDIIIQALKDGKRIIRKAQDGTEADVVCHYCGVAEYHEKRPSKGLNTYDTEFPVAMLAADDWRIVK